MSKLAIVTGGIRGIGAATLIALKNNGYKVIANYLSQHQLAQKFTKDTGIKTMAWDVSNAASCQEAIEKIEAEFQENVSIL
jgi:acetoacetyl-CoA reductase